MPGFKTRVEKTYDGDWRVNFYMPYSGSGYFEFTEWRQALDRACKIEKEKSWL